MHTNSNTILSTFVLCGVFGLSACSGSAEKASAERGEALFNDPGLAGSVNAFSCANCHPGGEGLAGVAETIDPALTINRCITGPLEGTAIDTGLADMKSLVLYLESLEAVPVTD